MDVKGKYGHPVEMVGKPVREPESLNDYPEEIVNYLMSLPKEEAINWLREALRRHEYALGRASADQW